MMQRSPDVIDLVRRLLEHEAGGARDHASLALAGERACHKLCGELGTLVGRGGAAALFGRASNLAQREIPWLPALRSHADAPLSLAALGESLREREAAEVEAACTLLLANVLELLVNLLGEELGLRPVMNVWPNLAPPVGLPDSRETEE